MREYALKSEFTEGVIKEISTKGPKFGTMTFFNDKPYGKVGTDYDRTVLKKFSYPPQDDFRRDEKIEHNTMIKLPARQRAYDLIHEQFPWLDNVVHYNEGESITFWMER